MKTFKEWLEGRSDYSWSGQPHYSNIQSRPPREYLSEPDEKEYSAKPDGTLNYWQENERFRKLALGKFDVPEPKEMIGKRIEADRFGKGKITKVGKQRINIKFDTRRSYNTFLWKTFFQIAEPEYATAV